MNVPAAGPGARRWPPPVLGASGNDLPRRDLPGDGEDDLEDHLAELDGVQRSALQDPARWALWEIVARTPGLNKSQVARRAGVGWDVAHHRLIQLEVYGLIETVPGARGNEVLCFLPVHAHLGEQEDVLILYGQAPTRHVALYVDDNPGATTAEIAEVLDRSSRSILDHLGGLRDRSLVEKHRFHRRVEYYPTQRLTQWVDEVGGCYERPF